MGNRNGQVITPAAPGSSHHLVKQDAARWLAPRRGLVITGAVAAGIAALAFQQHWLVAADLVPLLFALPCAAMMFLCMKGMNHGQQTDTARDSSRKDTTTAGDLRS